MAMVFLLESHVREALRTAGLQRSALRRGSDPDSGAQCPFLEATPQQYGVFLVSLARQLATGERDDQIAWMAEQVQLQMNGGGDTVFWLQGVKLMD